MIKNTITITRHSEETETLTIRLTRLASEVQRTTRRLNSLDHLMIPRHETERDFIQLVLDERERSDIFGSSL